MAVALLALGATLEAARSGLQFHAPTLVGPGSGYASNFQAISPSVFFGASLHDFISRDSGKTWQAPPAGAFTQGFAGIVGDAFFRTTFGDQTTVRNLGYDLAGVAAAKVDCGTAAGVNDSWYSCYTAFSTPWHAKYSIDASTGKPIYTRVNETTTFSGFPHPVSLHGDTAPQLTEHDFGRDGGAVTVLSDGTLVMTADVRWGHDRGAIANAARAEDLTLATSVVSLRSTDGKNFRYSATLCEAANHRGCGECCNENSVVTLADGKSVISVWRMGAGDGLIWNK